MAAAKKIFAVFLLTLILSATVAAQALEKRHQVGIRAGWFNQVADVRTEISPDGVETSVGTDGVMGGVFYEHWLYEYLALDVTVEGMAPNVEVSVGTSGVTTETATIGQLLFGMKYYFPRSTYLNSVRPNVRAGLGVVVGSLSAVEVGLAMATEERSETALGGYLGAGVDFALSRHFMLAVDGGYNFMADFAESIGGSKNYSGLQFSIGLGCIFGKGIN